jgi:putative mycofactocin binding protein MftB
MSVGSPSVEAPSVEAPSVEAPSVEAPSVESISVAAPGVTGFDAGAAWALHPQVALRPEEFGALAYHYGNRRLVFLKSEPLVDLVTALGEFDSAQAALQALVEPAEHRRYEAALARLAASEVIRAR